MGTSGTRLRVGLRRGGPRRPGGARLLPLGRSRALRAGWRWPIPRPGCEPRWAIATGSRSATRRSATCSDSGWTRSSWPCPDAFHADVACQGLEAGLHVLCWRSRSRSRSEECDRIAARARRLGAGPAGLGTMKRYDPAYLRLLELLPESAADRVRLPVGRGARPGIQAPVRLALAHDGRHRSRARARPGAAHAHGCADPRGLPGVIRPPAARARSRPTSPRSCTTSACCRACSSASASRGASAPTTAPGGTRGAPSRSRAALPGGGRAHLMHHNLTGVNDYSEPG